MTFHTKLAFAATLGFALAFTLSCSLDTITNTLKGDSSSSGGGGKPGGSCDISDCKSVQIGTQVWMAKDLNYDVAGGKCYGEGGKVYYGLGSTSDTITLSPAEIQANCDKYGRLYDWATAMALPSKCNSVLSTSDTDCAIATPNHRGICPSGWHIPSEADWDALMKAVGGSSTAGKYLKATSGWNDNGENSGNGTDKFEFAALPGGYGFSGGSFSTVGYNGSWWSATENYAYGAYGRIMFYDREGVSANNVFLKRYLYSVRCLQDQ